MCGARRRLPWMSFGSDAEASAPEGVFLKSSTHPRAYGNFARFLGNYVRDEKVVASAPTPSAASLPCRRKISDFGPRPPGSRAWLPMWSSSTLPRSPITRPSKSRCNMRPAFATFSSTASRCS